ncbi:DNA polymerase III subunit gamma and tau [Microbacterium halotolerans]|uniref:DNA polymerase III subunit gamma and tau n=1 Tax=Microbacterium halotolerans TaxID=246613 RepID=UPI000E6AB0C6|nr:DNA polymerase III subunit gamma and tau [Microbacterium halotolerans]
MTTALYRRYRPETFGEMIGQAQVTDPLMTALRGDRIGHAYLFSGPRGCGKTTSARILARCLNCAEGPTDTPCGTCDSCVELSRAGGGSLDVIEIDAASHNGVDDARDLRERAVFAPSRDRYKIFILDEAHMVTPQGFNALLKLVEEPPEHVKFIFATTEPDKVIGTIRSRTHHYPFRLVPPAAMLEYVESLCAQEGIAVEPGVLPLVVRAGGGSPRDTLSILDQLIAGSDESSVGYERAVALLGYTHGELLDGVVEAFASDDAGAAFSAVDRVVQTGQDPRRFVDDLLERLRDLIIIAATGAGAAAVLRGTPTDELQRMSAQAQAFGSDRLSRSADIVSATLDEMGGATAPRLQLELMIARVLTALRASAAAAQSALSEGETGAAVAVAPAQQPGAAAPVQQSPPAAPAAGPVGPAVAAPASPAAAPAAAPASPTAVPAAPTASPAAPAAPANPTAAAAGPAAPANPTDAPPAAAEEPPAAADPTPAPESGASPAASPDAGSVESATPAAAAPADETSTTEAMAASEGSAATQQAAQAEPSPAAAEGPVPETGVDPRLDDVPAAGWATVAPGTAHQAPATSGSAQAAPADGSPQGTAPGDSAERPAQTAGTERPGASAPAGEAPSGPLTLARLNEAWPRILDGLRTTAPQSAELVGQSRAAEVRPGDVVMMAFPSQRHMSGFKGAPADDLRNAIVEVLGVRVKYLARVEPQTPAPSEDAPPPDDDPEPGSYDDAYARPESGPSSDSAGRAPREGSSTSSGQRPAPAGDTAATAQRGGASDAPAQTVGSGAPVTEWAVAAIPGAAGEATTAPESADETSGSAEAEARPAPSDAASGATTAAPATPPQSAAPVAGPTDWGVNLKAPGSVDTEPPTADAAPEVAAASTAVTAAPASAAPAESTVPVVPAASAAPAAPGAFAPPEPDPGPPIEEPPAQSEPADPNRPTVQRRQVYVPDGVERRGEAVVRQMLGATFLHEEPYDPPSTARFS